MRSLDTCHRLNDATRDEMVGCEWLIRWARSKRPYRKHGLLESKKNGKLVEEIEMTPLGRPPESRSKICRRIWWCVVHRQAHPSHSLYHARGAPSPYGPEPYTGCACPGP